MGAMSGFLGLAGGANGTGFSTPGSANIVNPTNAGQISGAYTGAQNSLQSQQALLQALQAQQGIQNQSQVFNQFQGVANGTGPNPAQTMLNQATGANVANQAALMAGQRGAAQNVGLIARQAAQQGSQIQQQAAGQGATLQAQQALGAIGQMGGIASAQVANQVGQTNANAAAQQSEQQNLINAQLGVNNTNAGMQGNINNVNGQLANTMIGAQQGTIGGLMNNAGKALGMMAAGGDVGDAGAAPTAVAFGPQSMFGQFLNSGVTPQAPQIATPEFSNLDAKELKQGTESLMNGLLSKGPAAPVAMAGGPEAADLAGAAVMAAARGGMPTDFRGGGKVQAKAGSQKAVASGDSYSNDKIPAVLSEHEIVVPRSITMGKDPINDSARFVAAVLAKRGMRR